MIHGRDFLFTGLQPWDLSIGSNARDIALEISRHNRVLYVNTPLVKWNSDLHSDRTDMQQRLKVLRGEAPPLRQVRENLWVLDFPFTLFPVNALPDGRVFDRANRMNNRKMFRYIARLLAELGFGKVIHFIDNDIYRSFYADEYLPSALRIYYRRDNMLSVGYWARHARRLEPRLIRKSGLVACNSAYLAQTARALNPHTVDIGQGVDLSGYTAGARPLPEELAALPRPLIGYVGHITALRLDPGLIHTLARRNPSRSFVLVGSVDDVFARHPLRDLPNVFFTGFRKPETVPGYIDAFDICINPQVVNDATIGNYPRKVDEYLALGKPVVATRTETMELFRDYAYLCASAGEYQQAFDRILAGEPSGIRERRIRFAHSHTWEASVKALYEAIAATLQL